MSNINNSFESYNNSSEEEKKLLARMRKETKMILLKYLIPCTLLLIFFMVIFIGAETNSDLLLHSNEFNPFILSRYFSFYWILSTAGLFLILKIFLILRNNTTPIFKDFIKKELATLELNLKTNYFYQLIYLITLIISSMIFILLDLEILNISNKISLVLKILFSFILFISTIFQIGLNTKRVKLRNNYYISIRIKGPIFKKSEIEMIKIYLKSSVLRIYFDKNKKEILSTLSNNRWLEMEKMPLFKKFNLDLFVKITEFSTFQNFYYKFLDLALAIRAWDKKLKSNVI